MPDQPTNLDLQHAFEAHALDDAKFQTETKAFNGEMAAFKAETEGSLAAIHEKLAAIPTREEQAQIVTDVIRQLLLKNGRMAFNLTVGASILIGALVVILGGAKSILGWLGFMYTK